VRVTYSNLTQTVFILDRVVLVRVTYRNLTQTELIVDRVKSSSCELSAKIPVALYSNSRCFKSFNSGNSPPEIPEFLATLCLVSLGPKPPLVYYPVFIVCHVTTFSKRKARSK
jgi:hypothetical protein